MTCGPVTCRPPDLRPVSRQELTGDPLLVARRLLGAVLVHRSPHGTAAVRLSEVEAYAGVDDPGSHAFRGLTRRNAVMFGPPGHLYVYFTYGMHWCANVVTGTDGVAAAVLLRAGEVVRGVELAAARRPAVSDPLDLARGPARLCSALGLDGGHDGDDLCRPGGRLQLLTDGGVAGPVATGPRVGVAGDGGDGDRYPWRLWLTQDPTVSRYRPAKPRRRRRGADGTLDGGA